jgi:hypothetical protein
MFGERNKGTAELLQEAEGMGKELISEARAIKESLDGLTSRIDRLIMILAVIGGINSLLGNGLLETLNQGRKSQAELKTIESVITVQDSKPGPVLASFPARM